VTTPARRSRRFVPGEPGPRLLSRDLDLHLVRRFTYGPTEGDVNDVRRLGRKGWIDTQLHPTVLPDPHPVPLLDTYALHAAPAAVVRATLAPGPNKTSGVGVHHVVAATIARARLSRRQLLETLVETWHDHLHVYAAHDKVWDLLPQRDAGIRQRALGRFSELLAFSTRDPAMLRYLDQDTSRAPTPNENLAREMLELHTLGAGHFSEDDVKAVARTLTGLTVGADGQATVNPRLHVVGPVAVGTWSHANPDQAGADGVIAALLDHLAHHPDTARNVVTRLARRYVRDNPSPELVEHLAQVYLAHDTEIAPVVRALALSPEMAQSVGLKHRRPYESAVFALRTLRVGFAPGPDPVRGIADKLRELGHLPMHWAPPDGFPDTGEEWAAAGDHIARWNLQRAIVDGAVKGLVVPRLASTTKVSSRQKAGDVVDRVARRVLLQHVTPHHRTVLHSSAGRSRRQELGDLALLPGLVALVLGSPYAMVR
jgi:uncharacterized protein (DUF1800 family)